MGEVWEGKKGGFKSLVSRTNICQMFLKKFFVGNGLACHQVSSHSGGVGRVSFLFFFFRDGPERER